MVRTRRQSRVAQQLVLTVNSNKQMLTCEWIRGISSGFCSQLGNINRRAASLEHSMCQWGVSAAFSVELFTGGVVDVDSVVAVVELNGDDGVKPGGGSTPSSISRARCNRAFLSQSSMG